MKGSDHPPGEDPGKAPAGEQNPHQPGYVRPARLQQQSLEVDRVKRSEHGVIVDPVTLPPDATAAEASRIMDERNISGVPITVDTIR